MIYDDYWNRYQTLLLIKQHCCDFVTPAQAWPPREYRIKLSRICAQIMVDICIN